jgi:hypothetical protein
MSNFELAMEMHRIVRDGGNAIAFIKKIKSDGVELSELVKKLLLDDNTQAYDTAIYNDTIGIDEWKKNVIDLINKIDGSVK